MNRVTFHPNHVPNSFATTIAIGASPLSAGRKTARGGEQVGVWSMNARVAHMDTCGLSASGGLPESSSSVPRRPR